MTAGPTALTPLRPQEGCKGPQLGGEEGVVRLYYPLLRGRGAGKADSTHLFNEGRLVARWLYMLVFVPVGLLFRGLFPDTEGGSEVALAAAEGGGVETH